MTWLNGSLGNAVDNPGMAEAVALSARLIDRSVDAIRAIAVGACGLALIAAGQAFPF